MNSNPLFQAFVASMLQNQNPSDEAKILKLDQFLQLVSDQLMPSRDLPMVQSLEHYKALRNQSYETPAIALQQYARTGLFTPLTIQTSKTQVLQDIIDYEAKESADFLQFARTKVAKSPSVPNVSSALWEKLPEFYKLGQNFRDDLDQSSADFRDHSFAKADELRSRGNPLGIFAFIAGVGAHGARAVGENIVNPVVRQALFNSKIQEIARAKLLNELKTFQTWPAEKKLSLVRQFETTLSDAIEQEVRNNLQTAPERFGRLPKPLVRVVTEHLIPTYLKNISAEQKASVIWSVLSEPHFQQMPPPRQMQIVLNALGPLFPTVLRQLTRLPSLRENAVAKLFCCSHAKASEEVLESVRTILTQAEPFAHAINLKIEPVSSNSLKDTFLVTFEDRHGSQRKIVQRVRPDGRKNLAADFQTLSAVARDVGLVSALTSAGAERALEIIPMLESLMRDEIDLRATAALQQKAQDVYGQKSRRKINGQEVDLIIRAAAAQIAGPTAHPVLLQDFAEGLTIEQARAAHPQLVHGILESFADNYLRNALSPSGFLWADVSAQNMRIKISADGRQAELTLYNFGASHEMTADEVRGFYKTLGRFPFLEAAKLSGSKQDPARLTAFLQRLNETEIPISLSSLRFATGLTNLRGLLGPEQFLQTMTKFILKHPSVVWMALGEKIKSILAELIERFQVNQTLSDRGASPLIAPPVLGKLRCQGLF